MGISSLGVGVDGALVDFAIFVFVANKKLVKALKERNIKCQEHSVLYLILSLMGLNVITYTLIQNNLNKVVRENNE